MSERNTLVRSLHDLGLSAWFGGSLAGAVAVNGAAADVTDPVQRLRVANAGWARWTPVNAAAIGAHLVGGAGLLAANRGRVAAQSGVGASTTAKLAVTGAALAVTAYSRALGKKLQQADGVPVEGGTDPSPTTPPDIAKIQKRLAVCQWLIPALTGALTVLTSLHGEQQRPGQQLPGVSTKPGKLLRAAGTAATGPVGAVSAIGAAATRAAAAGAAHAARAARAARSARATDDLDANTTEAADTIDTDAVV
jgi:hypothetical protein